MKHFNPEVLKKNNPNSKRGLLFNTIASLNPKKLQKPVVLEVAKMLTSAGYKKSDKHVAQGLGSKIAADLQSSNKAYKGLVIRDKVKKALEDNTNPVVTHLEVVMK